MVDSILTLTLDVAYGLGGVAALYTPQGGTGSMSVTLVARPAQDDVAELFQVGDRNPGYAHRVRQVELPARPRVGDTLAIASEGLTLRIRHVETSALDAEWFLTAVLVLETMVVPGTEIGVMQPPYLVGAGWALA